MSYQIVYDPPVERELAKLDRNQTIKILEAISKFQENPFPSQCKKLHGRNNQYRIRVGNFRVLYVVDKENFLVRIAYIKNRKDAYR